MEAGLRVLAGRRIPGPAHRDTSGAATGSIVPWMTRRRRWVALVFVAVSALLGGSDARATSTRDAALVRLPAAGELVATTNVRAEPRPAAPIVRMLRRFRADQQFQIVLATVTAPRGGRRVVVPAQPPGAAERRARLGPGGRGRGAAGREPDRRPARRRGGSRCGASATAGCCCRQCRRGRRGRARRRRSDAASTCSRRSCRPTRSTGRSRSRRARSPASPTGRPGVVGIHGTNLPELLGQAVSHGCIRVVERHRDAAPAARAARHADRHRALS